MEGYFALCAETVRGWMSGSWDGDGLTEGFMSSAAAAATTSYLTSRPYVSG